MTILYNSHTDDSGKLKVCQKLKKLVGTTNGIAEYIVFNSVSDTYLALNEHSNVDKCSWTIYNDHFSQQAVKNMLGLCE